MSIQALGLTGAATTHQPDRPALVFFVIQGDRLVYLSDEIQALTSCPPASLLEAGSFVAMLPADHQAEWLRLLNDFREQQSPTLIYELPFPTPTGGIRWIEITLQRQTGKDNMIGTLTDITARKEPAQETHRLLTEGLHNTLVLINNTLDVKEIFNQIMHSVGQLVPHETANVMLIDEEGMITIEATYRYDVYGLDQWMKGLRLRLQDYPVLLQSYTTGQAHIIEDTTTYPNWHAFPETRWIRSKITIPIHLEHEVIGFINLDSDKVACFTSTHAQWLQLYADQAAAAIKNARLFEQERRQRLFAEALSETARLLNSTLDMEQVLKHLSTQICEVIQPSDSYTLSLIENDYLRPVEAILNGKTIQLPTAKIDASRPLCVQQMIFDCQPVLINISEELADVQNRPGWEWVQSLMGVPIFFQGELQGIIMMCSRQPYAYSPRQLKQLTAFADQVALAIRNARLYTDLNREQAQLSSILDATHEGICYIQHNKILYANESFARMLGYTRDEIIGKPYTFCWENYHKQELISAVHQTLQRGDIWQNDLRLRQKNGNFLTTAYSLSAIGSDQAERMVAVVRDISQEQQLRSRQTRFITNAAHELRHPLTRLINRLYLMRRQPEHLEEHLNVLQGVSNDMTRLIGDMAEIIQLEQGDVTMYPVALQLDDLLKKVLDRYNSSIQQRHLTVKTQFPANLPAFLGDLLMTTHFLDKVLHYVMTHTHDNGIITCEVVPQPDALVFSVAYTGTPLPMRERNRVFDPFFQPSEGERRHSGLELAIANQIAQLHQWELTAEGGCEFKLKINV